MESLEKVRRQVTVAQDMQSVARTMKTLAAVSIRQFESAVAALADYNRTLRLGFQVLFREKPPTGDSNRKTVVKRCGALVFGSDQGMCGQFNEVLSDYVLQHFRTLVSPQAHWSAFVCGSRIRDRLSDAGIEIAGSIAVPGSVSGIVTLLQEFVQELEQWQLRQSLQEVYVFYNRRLTSATFRPGHKRLLPPNLLELSRPRPADVAFRSLPAISMDWNDLFRALLRQYIFVTVFRACAESLASENASRIAAMQAAEKNIEERLVDLQSKLNQMRQTAITEELLDIITGFEALESRRKR